MIDCLLPEHQDAAVDVTVLCGASVAREVAGAAFGDGGSGPRNAAALEDEASACAELASRAIWAGILICLALFGNLRLVILFSIDIFTDQGQICLVDMFKKAFNVL